MYEYLVYACIGALVSLAIAFGRVKWGAGLDAYENSNVAQRRLYFIGMACIGILAGMLLAWARTVHLG